MLNNSRFIFLLVLLSPWLGFCQNTSSVISVKPETILLPSIPLNESVECASIIIYNKTNKTLRGIKLGETDIPTIKKNGSEQVEVSGTFYLLNGAPFGPVYVTRKEKKKSYCATGIYCMSNGSYAFDIVTNNELKGKRKYQWEKHVE